jgi:hypothetical protein
VDIKYKLYPHPVLWDRVDDYKESTFECDIKMHREIRSFVFDVDFQLKDKKIEEMIEQDLAEFVLHIESSASSYRILKTSNSNKMKFTLSDDKILGKISLCPFIVSKQDIDNYQNNAWNDDYSGVKFLLSKGSILAIGSQFNFTVSKEAELSTLPSIFTIYKKETTEDMPMEIEINSDKIRIGLNIKDYENYSASKYFDENMVNIVNSFLIFPTLIYIFERLREGFEDYEDYRWFQSIDKMFRKYSMKLDIDLVKSQNSYELAQRLMSFPVSKSLEGLGKLGESEEQ